MPTEDSKTNEIREAISSGEYRKAQRLWSEYVDGLRAQLRAGTLGQRELERAGELLEWARLAVRCAQSHMRERLDNFEVAGAYREPRPRPMPRLLQTSL
ncbi:MAG: hypothetical protein JO336_07475 [Acidobacteriia bacterium]|nr:hypothetical protein [Terriglobia bacterium]MBV8903387.1 hypothetical protein [Terriglobia bacterium]